MTHLTDFQTFLLLSVLRIVVVFVITLTAVACIVQIERKVLGRTQNRWALRSVPQRRYLRSGSVIDAVKRLMLQALSNN